MRSPQDHRAFSTPRGPQVQERKEVLGVHRAVSVVVGTALAGDPRVEVREDILSVDLSVAVEVGAAVIGPGGPEPARE